MDKVSRFAEMVRGVFFAYPYPRIVFAGDDGPTRWRDDAHYELCFRNNRWYLHVIAPAKIEDKDEADYIKHWRSEAQRNLVESCQWMRIGLLFALADDWDVVEAILEEQPHFSPAEARRIATVLRKRGVAAARELVMPLVREAYEEILQAKGDDDEI